MLTNSYQIVLGDIKYILFCHLGKPVETQVNTACRETWNYEMQIQGQWVAVACDLEMVPTVTKTVDKNRIGMLKTSIASFVSAFKTICCQNKKRMKDT